jgi:Na+/glutamate symporter
MPLHCWSYLLGLICLLTGAAIVAAPAPLSRFYNALPRSVTAGRVLSTIAWIWAGYALWSMQLDFLEPLKKFLPVAVLACIPLTWFWLDNLLACRAAGALLTLFPYELLHTARVHASPWRLVLVTLAYLCIVKGMILLLYPWKMRQATAWLTARPALFRLAGALNALLGLFLIGLGATVLR